MTTPVLTDRPALLRNRARASRAPVTFLHDIAADEIEEKLRDLKKSFTKVARVGFALNADVPDDETLPLGSRQHDLVIHSFGLHWANDPVGQMVQCRLALEPDGLFIGVLFGGQTLHELRACLAEAETQVSGGLSPRVLPMADVRDLGNLVQRAGLALPVADTLPLTVRYKTLSALVRDLRGMGEVNAMNARRRSATSRALFSTAEAMYRKRFSDEEGYLLATFELVFLTGWAPSETQQKPLRPGSATARLSDALGADEFTTGDPATPKPR